MTANGGAPRGCGSKYIVKNQQQKMGFPWATPWAQKTPVGCRFSDFMANIRATTHEGSFHLSCFVRSEISTVATKITLPVSVISTTTTFLIKYLFFKNARPVLDEMV